MRIERPPVAHDAPILLHARRLPLLLTLVLLPARAHGSEGADFGASLPLYSVAPFAVMLLAIAILPLATPHWWERLRSKLLVSILLAIPVGLYIVRGDAPELVRVLHEYAAFICLLGSLFVISGGILLTGDLRATPRVNTLFLLCGAAVANLVGTTGASMLLIRPLLRTNEERRNVLHIPVFFIFLVSNIGGCLTPLGDPPLFLGFLRGVPFTWTLQLWRPWVLTTSLLLALFFFIDTAQIRKETRLADILDRIRVEPLRIQGGTNFLAFLGVLALVIWAPTPWREIGMAALAFASYLFTPKRIHQRNHFTLYPIQEVAILFVGIFVTMIPALLLLEARGAELGVHDPQHYFWATGLLSSFLDNAPTYLTFTSMALGSLHLPGEVAKPLAALVLDPEGHRILTAISLGAVFMGANSYIGNGPNFMVKSICEERGLRMPSFFGYMIWSVGILIPVFAIVSWFFLRS